MPLACLPATSLLEAGSLLACCCLLACTPAWPSQRCPPHACPHRAAGPAPLMLAGACPVPLAHPTRCLHLGRAGWQGPALFVLNSINESFQSTNPARPACSWDEIIGKESTQSAEDDAEVGAQAGLQKCAQLPCTCPPTTSPACAAVEVEAQAGPLAACKCWRAGRQRACHAAPPGAAAEAGPSLDHSRPSLCRTSCHPQVQADRAAALSRAKEQGCIDDYSGWRK